MRPTNLVTGGFNIGHPVIFSQSVHVRQNQLQVICKWRWYPCATCSRRTGLGCNSTAGFGVDTAVPSDDLSDPWVGDGMRSNYCLGCFQEILNYCTPSVFLNLGTDQIAVFLRRNISNLICWKNQWFLLLRILRSLFFSLKSAGVPKLSIVGTAWLLVQNDHYLIITCDNWSLLVPNLKFDCSSNRICRLPKVLSEITQFPSN